MMLALLLRGHPQMAARLSGDDVAKHATDWRGLIRTDRAGASDRDHFVAYKVEPDPSQLLALLKMATHCVADLLVKLRQIVPSVKIDSPGARAL